MALNNIIGLTYPLNTNGKGGLSISVGPSRIFEQIIEILDTVVGERIYRPRFGSPDIVFRSINTLDMVTIEIQRLLEQLLPSSYVSSVKVEVTSSDLNDGKLGLTVSYIYLPSKTRQTLLYSNVNSQKSN